MELISTKSIIASERIFGENKLGNIIQMKKGWTGRAGGGGIAPSKLDAACVALQGYRITGKNGLEQIGFPVGRIVARLARL